ncbi:TlpA disulfide reductase family protein [Hoeflea sp. YIM 152468]|uniref:thiol:disulfide interchange protein TlpA n=1 Tax=Hoeflea sp. YIM 152468 TaxID=3031759 RepID=UPI0023DAFBC1|nr:TlpA disulfide reductase family protein [Hoeflea sp. YIM 152468]MDF1608044.1 TlpA disulfide reductase family protein [Hoeflea sp. YIM 152468]
MSQSPNRLSIVALVAIAIALGVVVGAAGIYLKALPSGNAPLTESVASTAQAECTADPEILARLKPLAKGEVAAMAIREAPVVLPDMNFVSEEGDESRIADFAGQALLVNLWATWCAPCRAEMPALSELQTELGDDAFKVLAINIDTGDAAKPKAFLDEIGVANLGLYRDASMGVFNTLKKESLAFGLPVTLIIGKDGCLLGAMNGPAEWASDDAKALVAALKAG